MEPNTTHTNPASPSNNTTPSPSISNPPPPQEPWIPLWRDRLSIGHDDHGDRVWIQISAATTGIPGFFIQPYALGRSPTFRLEDMVFDKEVENYLGAQGRAVDTPTPRQRVNQMDFLLSRILLGEVKAFRSDKWGRHIDWAGRVDEETIEAIQTDDEILV
jgi:hypothetical protein